MHIYTHTHINTKELICANLDSFHLVYTKKSVWRAVTLFAHSESLWGEFLSAVQNVSIGQLHITPAVSTGCKCLQKSWIKWHIPSQQLNVQVWRDKVWKDLSVKWYTHNTPLLSSAMCNWLSCVKISLVALPKNHFSKSRTRFLPHTKQYGSSGFLLLIMKV